MADKKYTKADMLELEMKNIKKVNSDEHKNILKEIYFIGEKLDKFEQKHDEQLETICVRIGSLEIWRANLMGKITLATGIFSLAFTTFWAFIKSRFLGDQ